MQGSIIKFPSFTKTSFTYSLGDTIKPIEYDGPIILAIDPGKTLMSITVGSMAGQVIEFITMSGTGMDTTDYCLEFKHFLSQYIPRKQLMKVAYEAVIKRDDEKGSYISMVVLNEIQSNIKELCAVEFQDKSLGFSINNWAWKASVLPMKYRRKGVKKGSYDYLCSINPLFQSCDHNVTDSACIYLYYVHKFVHLDNITPEREEIDTSASLYICTKDKLPEVHKTFYYNPGLSLFGNAGFVKHRLSGNSAAKITNELSISDIYKLATNMGDSDEFYLVVY